MHNSFVTSNIHYPFITTALRIPAHMKNIYIYISTKLQLRIVRNMTVQKCKHAHDIEVITSKLHLVYNSQT